MEIGVGVVLGLADLRRVEAHRRAQPCAHLRLAELRAVLAQLVRVGGRLG